MRFTRRGNERRMKPRIERIKVNREGPLGKDFEMDPADLNLIYGLNETGKTYVLESLVRLLFKTKGKGAPDWRNLRDWDTNGRMDLSGVTEGDQVTSFGKTSKKLEDYLHEEDDGFPRDFSRLLVVRAGETVLSGDPGEDGIGRDILKDYLSEERLLGELVEGISLTIQGAQVTERAIVGDNRGELKTQKKLRSEVDGLKDLLGEVNRDFSKGPVSTLREELSAKRQMIASLERAKCHQAFLVRSELQDLEEEQSALEGLDAIGEMESKIEQYDGKVNEGVLLKGELKDLQATVGKRQWCQEALKNYDEIVNRRSVKGQEKVWGIVAAGALLAAVVGGLIDQKWLLVAGAVLSVVCAWMFSRKLLGTAPVAASDNVELKRMKQHYEEHFGKPLGDRASLTARLGSLQEDLGRAEAKQDQLGKSNSVASDLRVKIGGFFLQAGFEDLEPGDWRKTLAEMRAGHRAIESKISECSTKLEVLVVPVKEGLEEDPGITWDAGRFDELSVEVDRIETDIEVEDGRLGGLREQVALLVGARSATDWDELLEALQEQKNIKTQEYRKCTAEILAKIELCRVLEDMRQKETERIEQGLQKPALTAPLSSLTGNIYQSIHLDEEGGLELGDTEGNYYALTQLSTGVREQICLALRFGFASIALGGEPAFLLLDDAFQHSDWKRRPKMIEYVVKLVNKGWQVFYFTMDDHIRAQFEEAGHALGSDRFLSMDLGAGEPVSAG